MRNNQNDTNIENLGEIKYLKLICEFDNFNKSDIRRLIPSSLSKEKKLWTIFGKEKSKCNIVCLQVGSSINITTELREILSLMISKSMYKTQSTTFHDDVFSFYTHMDKQSIKYRFIKENYEDFKIYEIIVEDYLENIETESYNPLHYAEVKFAFDNKALLWNPAPQTRENKETEIYKRFLNCTPCQGHKNKN